MSRANSTATSSKVQRSEGAVVRVLLWLGLAVAAGVSVAACATGPTQGSVSIITQIDFTESPSMDLRGRAPPFFRATNPLEQTLPAVSPEQGGNTSDDR
jgi:hypothetical protein